MRPRGPAGDGRSPQPAAPGIALPVLARAHATLVTGCDFVSRRPLRAGIACPVTRGVHGRMAANHLRELDRFLCVLLEEAAALLGGPAHDAPRFARSGSTPDKLRLVQGMIGVPGAQGVRLAAIRRIARRLRSSPDPSPRLQAKDIMLACGQALDMPPAVKSIARFYRDLGDQLMQDILTRRRNS